MVGGCLFPDDVLPSRRGVPEQEAQQGKQAVETLCEEGRPSGPGSEARLPPELLWLS